MKYRALITEQYYVEFEAPDGLPNLYLKDIAEDPENWAKEDTGDYTSLTASEMMPV